MKNQAHCGLILAVGLTSACGTKQLGEDAKNATSNIRDAAAQAKEGMQAIGNGLAQLDALGLKELIKTNDALRAQLGELQALMDGMSSAGGIVPSKSLQVVFSVTGHEGTLKVSGWVDEENNTFLSNAMYAPEDPVLDLASTSHCGAAIEDAGTTAWRAVTHMPMDGHLWHVTNTGGNRQGHPELKALAAAAQFARAAPDARMVGDTEWKADVNAAFQKFLANPLYRPRTAHAYGAFHLNQKLNFTSGKHRVFLSVVPTHCASGKWSIEHRLVAIRNGAEEVLNVGRMDHTAQPGGCTEGEPVKFQAAEFNVRLEKD